MTLQWCIDGRNSILRMLSNVNIFVKRYTRENLVIIGGSAAGPSAAARARRVNSNLNITMFEQGQEVIGVRLPMLSKT
jgi:hypothetical protein